MNSNGSENSNETEEQSRDSSDSNQPDTDVSEGTGGAELNVDHDNPIDVSDVTDAERADMLREYIDAFVREFGNEPKLMPLDDEGKQPIIVGKAGLDTRAGLKFLVDADEAVRRIREDGARGFAIYAGKPYHNTKDAVFVDHDDMDAFSTPTADPTLKILSGSGRGHHETYRNAGDVDNARVGDNVGEIRAENWYVVTPGSVHPSGGVYHVTDDRPVAILSDDDLDDSMRPASNGDRERTAPDRTDRDTGSNPDESSVTELDGDGDRPDEEEIGARLERAFANRRDGERIEQVYNGKFTEAGFDDRSSAEFWLANRLDAWVALGDEEIVRDLLDKANLQKWPKRTDASYRESVLSKVGHQSWYAIDDDDEYASDAEARPDYGREPTVPLDMSVIAALSHNERRRYARKRGFDWPTTDELRKRIDDALKTAMANADRTVIPAPTAAGKSFTAATVPWRDVDDEITGGDPVLMSHRNNEARDDAYRHSVDAGLEVDKLEKRDEMCPVAAGYHDGDGEGVEITVEGVAASDYIDRKCEESGSGLLFSMVHNYVVENNDQGATPECVRDGECPSQTMYDDIPTDDDGNPTHDIIHASHNFLHVPSLRSETNVIVDELADFSVDMNNSDVRTAIEAFLRVADAPVTTWAGFVSVARSGNVEADDKLADEMAAEAGALRDYLEYEPEREWYFTDDDAHGLARGLAKAVFYALRDDPGMAGRRSATVDHYPPRPDGRAYGGARAAPLGSASSSMRTTTL